jgi:hypothetical protein
MKNWKQVKIKSSNIMAASYKKTPRPKKGEV